MGQEQEWDCNKEIHQRPGCGDEDLVAASTGACPPVVCATQSESELSHRNSKDPGDQHVAHLMHQQAGYKGNAYIESKPPSAKLDADEVANGNEAPSCVVHAERNNKFIHIHTQAHSTLA